MLLNQANLLLGYSSVAIAVHQCVHELAFGDKHMQPHGTNLSPLSPL